MAEIKCPKCGEVFKVDENEYASIVSQIKEKEVKKEVEHILEKYEALKKLEISDSNQKITDLKNKEIEKLNKELNELKRILSNNETQKLLDITNKENEYKEKLSKKEQEITDLKNDLKIHKIEGEKRIEDAVSIKDKKIIELENKIQLDNQKHINEINSINENHKQSLKHKDEEIAYYKDLKAKQSTKLVGETLEQHCMNLFNQIRTTAFPNAYFEKDNEVVEGTKGDFVFKDFTNDGVEYVSIMFEMKNENDTTATKHKNEHFFQKLDEDRRKKNCEYAVLVSLLEPDNEFYNNGIVDVSYKYPKMYVIRPQFFLSFISLIRNASMNSANIKRELALVRNQELDVSNFEQNLEDFKDKFSKNYITASNKFMTAIEEIDKTIEHLKKVKDNLISSERNLRLANDKAQDLSIKKLTKNSPSLKDKFDQLDK